MELSDVSKVITVEVYQGYTITTKVKVIMGIKAPRGSMFLFGSHLQPTKEQGKAIKAFMRRHRND